MAYLYLIPSTLGESEIDQVLPLGNIHLLSDTRHYIVENIRTARRFLKRCNREIDIDKLQFYELNKRTDPAVLNQYLQALRNGENVGVISEAGCPGVADPGADVVRLAHEQGLQIRPLVGPSSILLAMMASGLNGQNFAFVGYLPVKTPERGKRIKQLESRVYTEQQTQLFIETPYRNMQLWEDLVQSCRPDTLLCVAANLTEPNEYIRTMPMAEWKKHKPDLHKKPTLFLIGSPAR